jgi:hypothetical protein
MEHLDIGSVTRVPVPDRAPDTAPIDPNDGYPKIIRDQRELHGCETVPEVIAYWDSFLERSGRVRVMDQRELTPYINHSRWLADCPECNGGMACWEANPYACCLDCGHQFSIRWQEGGERAAAIRLLAGYPDRHRNWDPRVGETVESLRVRHIVMAGKPPVERNGLLAAANVQVPDEFTTIGEYMERLKDWR